MTPTSGAKSCLTCPSHRSSDQMMVEYSATLGCRFCPTQGRVLTSPPKYADADDQQRLVEETAVNCPSYGAIPPPRDNWKADATIAVGNPKIAVEMAAIGNVPVADQPFSCTACRWFVPGDVVQKELGYDAPLCSAKGRLLFPSFLIREAANCGTGLAGDNATTCAGVYLNNAYKHYTPPPPPPPVIPDVKVEVTRHRIDPRLYETDRPVSAEDEGNFIRAWRRVEDPEGLHDPAWLPIYDGEKLCGYDPRTTYGEHRPDLYIDHQGLLYDLACELINGETPVLIGTAGSGKSEIGCWLSWLMDIPFDRVDVKKGTEAYHFTGESRLVTDPDTHTPVTKFVMGRFAAVYDKPGVTMVNEPNLVQDVYEFLRPVFDNAKQLGIDEAQGIIVNRHPLRYVLCSQNPEWDPLYVGTETMSAADIDRISPIYVELPDDAMERQIIKTHCLDAGYDIDNVTVDKIMQVATDLRTMIANRSLPIAWGLRAQIKVAKKTRFYSFEKAYRRAIIDGMEPAVVDQIMASVKSVA